MVYEGSTQHGPGTQNMVSGLNDALYSVKAEATAGWQCHRRFPDEGVVKGVTECPRVLFYGQKLVGEQLLRNPQLKGKARTEILTLKDEGAKMKGDEIMNLLSHAVTESFRKDETIWAPISEFRNTVTEGDLKCKNYGRKTNVSLTSLFTQNFTSRSCRVSGVN